MITEQAALKLVYGYTLLCESQGQVTFPAQLDNAALIPNKRKSRALIKEQSIPRRMLSAD